MWQIGQRNKYTWKTKCHESEIFERWLKLCVSGCPNLIHDSAFKNAAKRYVQGVSWELTKSMSFVLEPGGFPGAKMGSGLSWNFTGWNEMYQIKNLV